MSITDFVVYDDKSKETSEKIKTLVKELEVEISRIGLYAPGTPLGEFKPAARTRALALTNLEQCFMWVGKAVRDDQQAREREQQYKGFATTESRG